MRLGLAGAGAALLAVAYGAGAAEHAALGNGTSTTKSTLQIQYSGSDSDGVALYSFAAASDGGRQHVLRVLKPTNPAPGVPHNFLYVLPVEPELGTTYGDGLETLRTLDAQNRYNLTIVAPSFATDPWYADNPRDPSRRYESFLTKDLVPWVTRNLASGAGSHRERNWLIGFSKSGLGAEDLLLRHPTLFAVAAAWDFPAKISTFDQFGASSADNYGTDANFQAKYRLTRRFVATHRAPFAKHKRIWIGGGNVFAKDVASYDALLRSLGIAHTTAMRQSIAHRWDSGWVPGALQVLSRESAGLSASR